MKNVFIALIVVLMTGCYGAQMEQLRRENAELRQRDDARRQKNAERDGYRPPGAPRLPSADPHGPSVQGGAVGVGQGQGGAMWARRQHGTYMGAVGEYPRQMTQGRKIKVTNLVCDDGARGFVCEDRDQNGEPDLNTWLSFRIDGQHTVCDSGVFHPNMGVSMLLPAQSCFVELGAAKTVKLEIRFFRNNGNPWTYADLDTTPYKTIVKIYKVSNGMMRLEVDEATTSAY